MIFKITGGECLIDKELYPILKEYSWHIDSYGYAVTTEWCKVLKKTGKWYKMHRVIIGMDKGDSHVDHINGNRSDNRLENLRIVTKAQNLWNMGKHDSRNKSGFKGVCLDKRRGTWKAEISENGNRHYLGAFKTKEMAAKAWNEAAIKLHGEYAFLNVLHDSNESAC